MIKTIREYFESRISLLSESSSSDSEISLELAAAVLMVEISLADSSLHEEEQQVIVNALQHNFHISKEEADTIIDLARKEVDHAVSLHDFTSLLNSTLSYEDRVRIVELLWQVAFADAVLDKYEEYYIRKISDLLYVAHKDFIKTKHRSEG